VLLVWGMQWLKFLSMISIMHNKYTGIPLEHTRLQHQGQHCSDNSPDMIYFRKGHGGRAGFCSLEA
jgi:hypothetical protein